MARPAKLIGALLVLLYAAAAHGQAPPAPASCGGRPFGFKLPDVRGRLYEGVASVSAAPVVVAFYSGYHSHHVHDALREALQHDPVVGKGGPRDALWAGFAIIDYHESWFVPAWIMDRAVADQVARHPRAVLLADRGECLSRDGTSDRCPGRVRTPYFKSGAGSILVTYRGSIMRVISGATPVPPFVEMMRRLTDAAARGLDYCQARQTVGGR